MRSAPHVVALIALLVASIASGQAPKLTRPPRLLHFVEAPFPDGETQPASVELRLVLDAEGRVEDATVTKSAGPAFDAAAIAAARAFEFSPAEVDGQPSRIQIAYRYEFVLRPVAPTTATLTGVVRDRATKRPLPDVHIELEGSPPTTSGADGRFRFEDVEPGVRHVTLSGGGLQGATRTQETFVAGQKLDARYDVSLPAPATTEPADDLEIVVSAPPLRRRVVATQVSADEAKRLPGTQGDVLRVLENMPGVARPSAGSGRLVVWGAAPEDTRVYVDGVPIPRLYHDGGLRSVLPTELVSSVELTPGGYGADYGRGLGGLVLVGLRELDESGVHGAVGLDLYDASASLRAKVGKRWHVALGLRRSQLDSELAIVNNKLGEVFPIPHYWDGHVRARVDLSPGKSLELFGIGSSDQLGESRDSLDPLLVTTQSRGVQFYRVGLRYREHLSNGAEVKVTPYAGFDRDRLSLDVGPARAAVDSDTIVAGVRGSWRNRITRWLTLEGGVDAQVQRASLVRDGAIGLPPREGDIRVFGQPPAGSLSADRWNVLLVGVAPYAEADFALAHGTLHLVPSLRVDPYIRSVSRRTPAVGDTPELGLVDNDFHAEPRLNVRWQPLDRLAIKAGAGLYYQQPAPTDLSAVFGNPTLPASHVVQVLAGASIKITRTLSAEVTGFYSASGDLAVRSPSSSPVLAEVLVPTGQGRAYGGQILLRQELWHGLFGWVSYTLSRAERRQDGASSWRPFDYDQRHALTIVAAYLLPRGVEVGVRARVTSGYPRTAVLGASYDAQTDLYQPIFGRQNQQLLPTFFQLDVRVAKRWKLRATELELYLDVQNVTNRGNAEEIVYNSNYTQHGYITGLPILPVLGLKWTF